MDSAHDSAVQGVDQAHQQYRQGVDQAADTAAQQVLLLLLLNQLCICCNVVY